MRIFSYTSLIFARISFSAIHIKYLDWMKREEGRRWALVICVQAHLSYCAPFPLPSKLVLNSDISECVSPTASPLFLGDWDNFSLLPF